MTISERAEQLMRARTPFVHATVVRAQQPTSARPGDEAILLVDGTIEGFVGGDCAQNSVRKAALGALSGSAGRLRRRQPVSVRRCAGDLSDAEAARPADPDLRINTHFRCGSAVVRTARIRHPA